MIKPPDKGVCDKHKSNKKVVCGRYGACRCCDAPSVFRSKMNHSVTKLNQKDNRRKENWIEQQYTMEEIYWSWQMSWIYVMMEIFYLTSRIYLKLVNYLVLKPKIVMRFPITVGMWRIWRRKEENLCNPSRSSKHFQKNYLPHLSI